MRGKGKVCERREGEESLDYVIIRDLFLVLKRGRGGAGGHLSTSLSSEMEAFSTSFSPSFMMHSSSLLLPDTGVTFQVRGLVFWI